MKRQHILLTGALAELASMGFLSNAAKVTRTFVVEAPIEIQPYYTSRVEHHDDPWRRKGKKRGQRAR